jgi:hypothetical protein
MTNVSTLEPTVPEPLEVSKAGTTLLKAFMGNQAPSSQSEDESSSFDPETATAQVENVVADQGAVQHEDDSSSYDSGLDSAQLKNESENQPASTQNDEESTSRDSETAVIEQGKSGKLQGPGMVDDDSPPIDKIGSLNEPEKPPAKIDLANMWRTVYNPNDDPSGQKNEKVTTRHANKNSATFFEDLHLPALFRTEDEDLDEDVDQDENENEKKESLFDHEHSEESNSSDCSGESFAESGNEEPGELIPQINFDGSVRQREVVQPARGLAHLKTPGRRKGKFKAPTSLPSETNPPLRSSRNPRRTGRHSARKDVLGNKTWHGTTRSATPDEEDDDKTPPRFILQMSPDGSVSEKELGRARRGELSRMKHPEEFEGNIPAKSVAKSIPAKSVAKSIPAKSVAKSEMPGNSVKDPAMGSAQFLAPKFDVLGKTAHAAMKWSRRSRPKDHGELLDEPQASGDGRPSTEIKTKPDFETLAKTATAAMKFSRLSRAKNHGELLDEPQASADEGPSADAKAKPDFDTLAAMKFSRHSRAKNHGELLDEPQESEDEAQPDSENLAKAKAATAAMKWSNRSRLISDPTELFAEPQASVDQTPKPEFDGKAKPEFEALAKSITTAMKWKRRSKINDVVAAAQGSSQAKKSMTSGADANATSDALAKLQTAMKWTRRSRGSSEMQMLDDDEETLG